MSPAIRQLRRGAYALAALVALTSCGGGDDAGSSAPQNILFEAIAGQTFGIAAPPLVATSTSGLAVTFSSGTPSVCTVSGTTITLTALGTCTVIAEQPGNNIFGPATPVARSFTVAGGQQTITFVSPGKQILGTPAAPLMATSTSGLVVAFSSTTPAVCTTLGTALTLLSAGTCTVNASQPGNANYFAAPVVTQTFQVEVQLLAQSIDYPQQGNQNLGTPAPALVATATSGLPVSFTSMTPAVCTVSGTALTLVSAGTCTTVASQAGNAVYAAARAVSRSVTVSAAAQTINFAGPGNQSLGTPPVALSATATSGLPVSLASTTPAVCTVNGSMLTLVALGTCTINASQDGNATFAAATPVTRNVTVSKATQTINFAGPGNQTLGTAPPPLTATASSGLPVSIASTTPSTCTVSGTTLTLVAAGSCIIDASQAGNATYAAAPTVSRAITVAAAALTAQTITFAGPGNQTLGTAPPPLTATASSGLSVSFASTTPSTCAVNGNTLTLVAAGSCIIDASQAGNATYAAAPTVSRVVTVAAAALTAQTITFTGPGNQTLGTATPPLSATASSGLPVSFASTTPSTCAVSGNTLTLVAAGSCIIDARQAGNATYAAAPTVSRVVTVATSAQTITFASPGNQTMGTSPPPLVATASSGLPVSLASSTPAVCMVSGSTLTLVAVGTCTLNASQAGNATYAPAAPVTHSITVGSAPLLAQTIAFAGPGNQTMGTAPPPLSAIATSGLPVSFASTTPAVCSVAGTALTLVGAGTCTLNANQAGDATYAAAPTVARSVTVSKAAQSITFAGPGNQTLGTAPPPLTAIASSGLPVSFATTTPAVCTVVGATLTLVGVGTCSIDANQGGNVTYFAAATVTSSITVSPAPRLPQSINFADPGPQTLLTATPALSANATSNLPVSFASTTPSVCMVSGTTLTLVAAGTCSIDASQDGNAAYLPAMPVTRSVTVSKATQTITFTNPGSQTVGPPTVTLSATSTSNLPVSFTSATTTICAVSNTTLTLVAAGTCTITANQAGNSTFAAATPVTVNLTVNPDPNVFANAGFEIGQTTTPGVGGVPVSNVDPTRAQGWLSNTGYVRSADARTGSFSALFTITDGLGGARGLFHNSVDHGARAPVSPVNWGTSPTLTFWVKGNPSETGNLNYALRYLASNGAILNTASAGARTIWTGNSERGWTQITLSGITIPNNTAAVFLEMTLAAGLSGTFPGCGPTGSFCNWGTPAIYLDDVNLPLLP